MQGYLKATEKQLFETPVTFDSHLIHTE